MGKGSHAPVSNAANFRNYKTKFCTFHDQGRCIKGAACTYAHQNTELRGAPDLTKTKICEDWQAGVCPNGAKCLYAHGTEELKPPTASYRTSMCKNWDAPGGCPNPEDCNFAHHTEDLMTCLVASDGHSLLQTPPPTTGGGGGRVNPRHSAKSVVKQLSRDERVPRKKSVKNSKAKLARPAPKLVSHDDIMAYHRKEADIESLSTEIDDSSTRSSTPLSNCCSSDAQCPSLEQQMPPPHTCDGDVWVVDTGAAVVEATGSMLQMIGKTELLMNEGRVTATLQPPRTPRLSPSMTHSKSLLSLDLNLSATPWSEPFLGDDHLSEYTPSCEYFDDGYCLAPAKTYDAVVFDMPPTLSGLGKNSKQCFPFDRRCDEPYGCYDNYSPVSSCASSATFMDQSPMFEPNAGLASILHLATTLASQTNLLNELEENTYTQFYED